MQSIRAAAAAALVRGDFQQTEEGILFPREGIMAEGEYFGRVNGAEWEKEGDNLIPTEAWPTS